MIRKPLKSLLNKPAPTPPLIGRTGKEKAAQTACAWFVWQRAIYAGALTPLFAKEGAPTGTHEIDVTEAIRQVGEAVGVAALGYVYLSPFHSHGLIDRAMAMEHCRLGPVLEFEWEWVARIQKNRREMMPEVMVMDEIVKELGIPPRIAKMLCDVALEATFLVVQRSTDHARAVDTETYRQLGYDAMRGGDPRAALAAQRALTMTQGSAKQQNHTPLTLEQIFATMKDLDTEPGPLALPEGEEEETI